jgi:uncharacterized protein (DUF2461 family)
VSETSQANSSRFAGFQGETFRYFAEVAADTSWETVERLQDLHARAVRGPMCELVAQLEAEFGSAKVYRLHRAPNLWIAQHAYLSRSANSVYGVTLDLAGLEVEAGWLHPRPELLPRYREAVPEDASGERLRRIVDDLERRGYEIIGDRLRSRPRGVAADHPRVRLLRHRSLVAVRRLGRGAWLGRVDAVDIVRHAWRELTPLADWLAEVLDGDSSRGSPRE